MMDEKIKRILTATAIGTLERLAFLFSSSGDKTNEEASEKMAASISFEGDFSGKLYIKMPKLVAAEMTANMLGIEEEEVEVEQQFDAIKEVVNVMCGNLLPGIAGEVAEFHIKTPVIEDNEIYEEDTGNEEKSGPLAVATLSIDGAIFEIYLFVDGDISTIPQSDGYH